MEKNRCSGHKILRGGYSIKALKNRLPRLSKIKLRLFRKPVLNLGGGNMFLFGIKKHIILSLPDLPLGYKANVN